MAETAAFAATGLVLLLAVFKLGKTSGREAKYLAIQAISV